MKLLVPMLATSLALAAVGCSSPSVNAIENANKGAQVQPVKDTRVITDEAFNRRVVITGIGEDRAPSGNKIVEAEAANLTSGYQRFRYKFAWYDPRGLEVTSLNATWIDETIPPGGRVRLTSVAPNARAEDFRLELLPR